jgi:hypothetical protein
VKLVCPLISRISPVQAIECFQIRFGVLKDKFEQTLLKIKSTLSPLHFAPEFANSEVRF